MSVVRRWCRHTGIAGNGRCVASRSMTAHGIRRPVVFPSGTAALCELAEGARYFDQQNWDLGKGGDGKHGMVRRFRGVRGTTDHPRVDSDLVDGAELVAVNSRLVRADSGADSSAPLYDCGRLDDDPMRAIAGFLHRLSRCHGVLTARDVGRLLLSIHCPSTKVICTLVWQHALSHVEVSRLDVSDVDLARRVLHRPGAETIPLREVSCKALQPFLETAPRGSVV